MHIGTCMHAVCAGAEAHARERKADPRSDHGLYITRTYGSVPERAGAYVSVRGTMRGSVGARGSVRVRVETRESGTVQGMRKCPQ